MYVFRTSNANLSNVTITTSLRNTDFETANFSNPVETVVLVLKVLTMVGIICGAIFGNSLVIASVIKFERLRGITNYFIVSLAFADFLVAMFVMPFNASMEISGVWLFGRTMCDVFNANDVLFSTASILHLCCISLDRYVAIFQPLQYETKMTKLRVFFMLCITWGASILISYIPIYTQLYTTEEHFIALRENPEGCVFIVNKLYAVLSSSVSFWIPCTVMVVVYVKIFMEARKQEKQIRATSTYVRQSNGSTTPLQNGARDSLSATSEQRYERRRLKNEHKAAKTLGIIMGAFILCFLPFFLWYVVTTFCDEDKCPYSPILRSALFWIGYFNSCLNPIIYAYFNRDFKNAFQKLLHMD